MQFSFSISVLSSQRTHAILKEATCFVDFERLGVLKGRGASDAARRGQLLGSRLFVTTKIEQNRSLSQATQFGSKTISGSGKQLIALARREKKEAKKELQPIREKKGFPPRAVPEGPGSAALPQHGGRGAAREGHALADVLASWDI